MGSTAPAQCRSPAASAWSESHAPRRSLRDPRMRILAVLRPRPRRHLPQPGGPIALAADHTRNPVDNSIPQPRDLIGPEGPFANRACEDIDPMAVVLMQLRNVQREALGAAQKFWHELVNDD